VRLKVEIEHGRDAFCLPERHLFVRVGTWELFVALAFEVNVMRWRTLPNTDRIPWSEPVPPPDDWRMQPTRRDGSSW